MDDHLISRLSALNTDFYRQTAGSFSATRRNSWPGWERLAALIGAYLPTDGFGTLPDMQAERVHVLDFACGNLRFESFLEGRFPKTGFSFTAVDNCTDFPSFTSESPVKTVGLDLIEALRRKSSAPFEALGSADIAVSFGFFHHIPGQNLREAFLSQMISQLSPGGIAAISLWDFAQDEGMHERAMETTRQAREELSLPELEPGDYILGWQDTQHAFRYCHSFSSAEAGQLAASVSGNAQLIEDFASDGRTGKLNTYLVFRKG